MTAQRIFPWQSWTWLPAMTTYAKSKVELDRATGAALEHNGVLIQDAGQRKVSTSSP